LKRRRPVIIVPFGAYRGRPVDQVPSELLEWYLKHFDDLWPWVRQGFEDELRHRARDDDGSADQHHGAHAQLRLPAPDVATIESIVQFARRGLARRYHPDVRGGDGGKLKSINSALDWIIEQARRAAA
jgi:hypothetical protein